MLEGHRAKHTDGAQYFSNYDFITLCPFPQVDLDDLPFSAGSRSVVRPSSEEALSMSPDVFRVQAMANSSPFEAFIRRWATGGLGRAGGARANWRY